MQLQNQHFQLLLNGIPVTDVTFDSAGTPALGGKLNVDAMKTFCAVMTLLIGELPAPASDLVLKVETTRRPTPGFKDRDLLP
jgi:hypothetical protein